MDQDVVDEEGEGEEEGVGIGEVDVEEGALLVGVRMVIMEEPREVQMVIMRNTGLMVVAAAVVEEVGVRVIIVGEVDILLGIVIREEAEEAMGVIEVAVGLVVVVVDKRVAREAAGEDVTTAGKKVTLLGIATNHEN